MNRNAETLNDNEKFVGLNLSTPALLEQMAEECAECAHAALKVARILRGENPTPVEEEAAKDQLIEEIADVQLCQEILQQTYLRWTALDIARTMANKAARWVARLNFQD